MQEFGEDMSEVKDIMGGIAFIGVGVFLCLTLKSCYHMDSVDTRDSHSKCYEQTHDKSCWYLK